MRTQKKSLVGVLVFGILLAQGAGAATLPLSNIFTNMGAMSATNVWQSADSSLLTLYTCTQSNDVKYFRGVFTASSGNSKLAYHSDDGARVVINGATAADNYGTDTHLETLSTSFKYVNYTFASNTEYCVEVYYSNDQHTTNDHDGITLYAYNDGGSGRGGLQISGNDAVCVGNTITLTADCGTSPFNWSSGNTGVATVNTNGAVTGVSSGSAVITVTDFENLSGTKTIYVVKPGISPSNVVTSVGVTNTFVLTNSAGSGTVTWNPQGTLSADTRTNKIAFASPGTTSMTATYAGCSANATITAVAVASLTADTGDLCGGGQVIYTAQSNPAGYESVLTWSGEGLSGTGAKRTNVYSTVGPHVVSISSGTSVKSITNTVYKIDIAQTTQTALADSTPALTYYLTNSYGAATWQLSGGGPSFASQNTGNSVSINPGSAAGTFILTAYATALPSCTDTATVQVVKVAFGATSISLCQGGSAPLPVTVTPTNYLPQLTFDTVTNLAAGLVNTHASISGTGTNLSVNGSLAGTAFVRVRMGNYTLFGPTLKIVRVEFPTNAWYAPEGRSAAFQTTVIPAALSGEVVYESANSTIATVSGTGTNLTIAGVTNGTTQVNARVGGQTCVSKSVDIVAVRSMPAEIDLCVGQSESFTATILPPTAPVVFSLLDTNVASIARNGNTVTLTGLQPGTTFLFATVNGYIVDFSTVHCVSITFATNDCYVVQNTTNNVWVSPLPYPLAAALTFRSVNTNIVTVSGAPPSLTVRGVTNGSTQIQAWLGTNQLCATKTVNALGPLLTSVTFSGTNTDYFAVLQDSGNGVYPTPHWTTTRSYPVAYRRNTRIRVSAAFNNLPGVANPAIVMGDGNYPVPTTTNTISGGTATTPGVDSSVALPNQVDFMNPLVINWRLSLDNGVSFLQAGSSTNPVYVTLANSITSNLYHTVAHLACARPGATDPTQAVVNTWAQFAGPANITTWDGKRLYYYRDGFGRDNSARNTAQLLSSANTTNAWAGHGQCSSFARLFLDSIAVNGALGIYFGAAPFADEGFIVKNWSFATNPPSGDPTHPYLLTLVNESGYAGMVPAPTNRVYGALTKQPTLHGQNTAPPSEGYFGQHFVGHYGGLYYDPSYGITYTDAADFESKAIAGYATYLANLDFGVRMPAATNNMYFFVVP